MTQPFRPKIPGSRSISARALICSALADAPSELTGLADCDDTSAMSHGIDALGARFAVADGVATVVPGGSLTAARVHCGASGTTLRFLTALSILTDQRISLTGTDRLMSRPMQPLLAVLRSLGKEVSFEDGVIQLSGTADLSRPLVVDSATSGQFVSGLLMALGALPGPSTVTANDPSSVPFIMMTVDVMKAFGGVVEVEHHERALTFRVHGGGYRGTRFAVEPDVMSANYMLAAALIADCPVEVDNLGPETVQGDIQMLTVLERMGAMITWTERGVRCERGPQGIVGAEADLLHMPDMSLTLAAVAAVASTPSLFTGLINLKHKESDRLAALVNELEKIDCRTEVLDDGNALRMTPTSTGVPPARIATYDDHRVAMAFGLLTLRNPDLKILDEGCVAKTWPAYFEVLSEFARHAGAGS